MDLNQLSEKLEIIIRRGVHSILLNKDIKLGIESKGFQDIVTAKDKLMEDYLIEEIRKLCPEDLFIAEEGHHNTLSNQRTWIIDPIDGTLNFAQNTPYYGVQLALFENQTGLLSIIYLPALQEYYCAIQNQGTFLNHQRLHLDPSLSMEQSIITFGDFSKSNPGSRAFQIKMMESLYSVAMKIRIQGSSSIDFAFVAGGKTHGHIMFSKRIWEIKPGLMLLEEAGASTAMIPGEKFGFSGHAIVVCANETIKQQILSAMEQTRV